MPQRPAVPSTHAANAAPALPLLRPTAALRRTIRTRPREAWVQGSLALQWRSDADPLPRPLLRVVEPDGVAVDGTDPAVAQIATGAADLPEPGAWVARLAQAVLEVLAHERPRQQLVRWLTPEVYADLSRHLMAAPPRRPGARRAVSSVHVSEPADGVVEATVVAVGGPRARALALRLEGWDGRWRCTRLALL